MRPRILLAFALLAAPLAAKIEMRFVADDWRIEGGSLLGTRRQPLGGWKPEPYRYEINAAEIARRLEIEEEAVADYLRGLDPKLPILVQPGFYKTRSVVGIWQLTEDRLRRDLRLHLTPALDVTLVNGGEWAQRVVKPNDGSESGWREPEIYLEREVDGKWVRGGKPPRCGNFAEDWQRDIVDLKPGEALRLEGYLPPSMSFDLAKPCKVKVRAVYVYRGGFMSRAKDEKPDPGLMGKTPPFTLVSEPVEIDAR